MKVFISRVSTDEQSELRQIQNVEGFDKVIIDKCSVTGCSRPYLPVNHLSAFGPLAMGRRRSRDTSTGGGEGNTTLAVTFDSKQSPTSAPTAAPTSALIC